MPIIVSKPHILKQTTYKTIVDTGTYLSEIVDGLDTTSLYIELNGTPIKTGEIPFIKLEENDIVTIINIPEGGDSGRMIATIATLAVAVVSSVYLGPAAAGVLEITNPLGVALVSAGVTIATTTLTTLAFNALIPPQQLPKADTTPTTVKPSITGTRNTYAIWKPIPKVYGTYRYYPPLAARYFTEIAGDDQYLRMLLCLGYGPLEIGGKVAARTSKLTQDSGIAENAIRIGDTDIHSYQDVTYEIGTIDQITLFTANIYEEQVNVNLDCQSTGGDDGWYSDNVSATRTTDVDTKEISLDLVFPTGLYTMGHDGKMNTGGDAAQVDFTIQIEDSASGDVIKTDNFIITGSRKETYRINKYYHLPYKGQFSVTVTRNQTYITDREVVVTDCIWTVLRSIKEDQPVIDNGKEIIYMALRIKATDQLSNVIDSLNIEATSIIPVYENGSWYNKATSNPAWIYYNQLTGEHVKNSVSEDDILLDDFIEWANFCNSLGLEFNYTFDSEQTMFDRLKNIATTGRASPAYKDGYFTIIWDRDTSEEPPVQIISPRNARNFQATKLYQNLPHALRVHYIDSQADYSEDEIIVYREGYDSTNATRFEQLDTLGVTTQEQAQKEGKYHLNQVSQRNEKFTVEMDFENIIFTRGDIVLLSYDIIEIGIKWGRIKSIVTNENGEATSIEIDELCPFEEGVTYGVQVRKQNGTIASSQVENPGAGEYHNLDLITPLADINIGDLVLFGKFGEESLRCKVLQVDYSYNLNATVTLIPEAPTVNEVGEIPEYEPHINLPTNLDRIRPLPPRLDVHSGLDTLLLDPKGLYEPTIVVSWTMPPNNPVPVDTIIVRWKSVDDDDSGWHYLKAEYSTGNIRIWGVIVDQQIQIQAKAISVYGVASDWHPTITHIVSVGEPNNIVPLDADTLGGEPKENFAPAEHRHDDIYLAKDNTEPYEPTEPYHPATKGYVTIVFQDSDLMRKSEYDPDEDGIVSNAKLWKGSAKYVSTNEPNPHTGENGDFWFQYDCS